MISIGSVILIISSIGLIFLALFCFLTYRSHHIPQFLLLGFAFFPFGIIAVIFSESNETIFAEISLYATVVAACFLIGFALSLLNPKIFEPNYFLIYLVIIHMAAISAATVTHEFSAMEASWVFGPPIVILLVVTLAAATWKAYTLEANQLALFCAILLFASIFGGTVSIVYRSLGHGLSAYITLFGLIVIRSGNQPESIALLRRDYLLLSGLKSGSELLTLKDLSLGVLIFGPKGPEFYLKFGELFEGVNIKKDEIALKLTHFYFAMLKPLLQDSTSIKDTFGPMPAFRFPGMQALAGTDLLLSKDLGDPRLQGQVITILVLFYPSRCESLELIRSLKLALYDYFQGVNVLEEISEESLRSFQRKKIEQLGSNLPSRGKKADLADKAQYTAKN